MIFTLLEVVGAGASPAMPGQVGAQILSKIHLEIQKRIILRGVRRTLVKEEQVMREAKFLEREQQVEAGSTWEGGLPPPPPTPTPSSTQGRL